MAALTAILRRTPRFIYRVLRFPILCWILFAFIWALLPEVPVDQNSLLASGQRATQFYVIWAYYPRFDLSYDHFGLDFQILSEPLTGARLLSISNQYNVSLERSPDTLLSEYHVSDAFNITSKTGTALSLPKFPYGDSIMLSRWFLHESGNFPMKVLTTRYPSGRVDYTLISHETDEGSRAIDPLAAPRLLTVSLPESSAPTFTFPKKNSYAPTHLVFLRAALFSYLGLLGVAGLATYFVILRPCISILQYILSATLSILTLVVFMGISSLLVLCTAWWIRNGRPNIPVRETISSAWTAAAAEVEGRIRRARDQRNEELARTRGSQEVESAEMGEKPVQQAI